MKKCTICGVRKEYSLFNKKSGTSDGYQFKCRDCSKYLARQYYLKNKTSEKARINARKKLIADKLKSYKQQLKCEICDEDESCCLEFHHKNRADKDFTIAIAVNRGYSWEKIEKEINKCNVLCSNCHKKVHAGVIVCPLV